MPASRLLIFGDSFADPRWPEPWTWIKQIQKYYNETQNFAHQGTGSSWSIKKLSLANKNLTENQKKDTDILFIMSQNIRFDFSFWKDPSHQNYRFEPSKLWTEKEHRQYIGYKQFYHQFIEFFVLHSKYLETDNLKTIGYLKLFEKDYNKILVMPCFWNPSNDEKTLLPENTKKFYLSTSPLVSLQEPEKEILPNHLIKHNHKALVDVCVRWFKHDKEPSFKDFQYKI